MLLDGTGNAEIARMLRSVNARTQMLRTLSLAAPGRDARTIAEITRITAAAAVNRDPTRPAWPAKNMFAMLRKRPWGGDAQASRQLSPTPPSSGSPMVNRSFCFAS